MDDSRANQAARRRGAMRAGMGALGFVMLASQTASAAEPIECLRARQLLAANKVQQAQPFLNACRLKQAQARSAPAAPTARAPVAPAPAAPAAMPAPAAAPPPVEAAMVGRPGQPAPPRAAGVPAGAATPARASEADASWLTELPTGFGAMHQMASTGMENLQANQSFALHTLSDYVLARARQLSSDPAKFPALAQVRLHDYKLYTDEFDAQFPRPQGDDSARRKVLEFFLSPASVAAYYAMPQAKEAGSAAGKALQSAVKQDRALAAAKGVELSVFGVALGDPLQLPACGDDTNANLTTLLTGLGKGAPQTCVGSSGADMAVSIAAVALGAAGVKQPPGRKVASVMLADSKCPNWVKAGGSCVLLVTLQDGIVGAISFQTAPAAMESTILGKLREKFRAAPAPDGSFRCSNKYGAVAEEKSYRWELPGVYATYAALGPDCLHGKVEMQAASFRRLAAVQQAQSDASEGKM